GRGQRGPAFTGRMGRGPSFAGRTQRGQAQRGPARGMPFVNVGQVIARMTMALDADKDGKVTLDEFTAGHKKRYEELDANKDGSLDATELRQAARKMQARIQAASQRGPGAQRGGDRAKNADGTK